MTPDQINQRFNGDDLAANFPSVRYAAGWAFAEHALGPHASSLAEREECIGAAEEEWANAIRLTASTYELLPGRFLLWPCTKWRYRFALDTVPSLHAIARAQDSGERDYDPELLETSRQNVNETIRILMGKYAWTLQHLSEQDPPLSENQIAGRLGAILGVALEGAALSTAQLAGGNTYAVLPPSLRSDNAGKSAIDLTAHTTRGMTFSAQVKKRVGHRDRKKYRDVALLCATHHMRKPDEDVVTMTETIARDQDLDRSRSVGGIVLKVMQGNRAYGCSPWNPQPIHTRRHTPRLMRAA